LTQSEMRSSPRQPLLCSPSHGSVRDCIEHVLSGINLIAADHGLHRIASQYRWSRPKPLNLGFLSHGYFKSLAFKPSTGAFVIFTKLLFSSSGKIGNPLAK
jgi:hypothetical protein